CNPPSPTTPTPLSTPPPHPERERGEDDHDPHPPPTVTPAFSRDPSLPPLGLTSGHRGDPHRPLAPLPLEGRGRGWGSFRGSLMDPHPRSLPARGREGRLHAPHHHTMKVHGPHQCSTTHF